MTGSFSVLDYVLFGLTLAISAAIGLFNAFRSYRTSQNTNDYLLGGRRMPLVPTALSVLVSFVSGISIVSYPAEIYTMGTAFVWTVAGACAAIIFSSTFILPVFYPIRHVSIYIYLQERFDSKILRLYGSILYQLSTLVYLAVALYAPSVALSGSTGISMWVLLLSVGAVCTVYTSVGGIKAVIWTDCFQAVVMYAGLIALAIQGTRRAGGVLKVFSEAREHGRLQGFTNTDPDPFQYMTVWTGFFGGFFYWLGSFGSDQTALQRYRSLPSLGKARAAIWLNVPCMLSVMALVMYIGLTMTAYYIHCDPRLLNKSVLGDQLVVRYMLDVLGGTYGLPGLFIACVFSGTLSTVSSGVNSLSAVFLEDVVKPLYGEKPLSERRALLITKFVAAVYGTMAVALAFAAGPLGGAFRAVSAGLGFLSGPLIGLILLGILCPWANWKGGLGGALFSTIVSLWIFVGTTVKEVLYPQLAIYTDGCPIENTTVLNSTLPDFATGIQSTTGYLGYEEKYLPRLEGVEKLYALSFIMYTCVGAMITVGVGVVVSLISGGSDAAATKPHLIFWTLGHKSTVDEDQKKTVQLPSEETAQRGTDDTAYCL